MLRKSVFRKAILPAAAVVGIAGFGLLLRAQSSGSADQELSVVDSICTFFGADHAKFEVNEAVLDPSMRRLPHRSPNAVHLAALTAAVASDMPGVPGGTRTGGAISEGQLGMIDQYLFSAMQDAGVQPAATTTDWEFIRRATLDLTGRIPVPARVLSFVADTNPAKRAALVDELIASPEWVDKWTMYFGDLLKNNSSNSQIRRYRDGVEAFYTYIKSSLAANKPYDQMTRELITAAGTNSYTTGEINYNVGGVVTGGPIQDIFDQQTANIVDTFLGIAHQNCLLCHNGAGHLTTLSLWGGQQTRVGGWGMAAFLSHTYVSSTAITVGSANQKYWTVTDNSPKADGVYRLNTTTGNRPPRQPIGTVTSIPPSYIFTGEAPKAGENYRAAFARMITADPQFARAAVNYLWAYFFGVGLVDPPDTFDPLRLDPDNPPPAPWTLQPSNPRLLNALTQSFIDHKYDLQWLMREIVNSQAYQLSSRYDGAWNDSWYSLYARKMVRRLWGEEIHDAIAISSNNVPAYNLTTYGTIDYAMQFPEPLSLPDGASGNITGFLDAFLRGNRDDQPRSEEGSILQALGLMNNSFVVNRTSPASPATGLLATSLKLTNAQLVNTLFLAVLSRYPTQQEMNIALANLANASTRNSEAQNLLWSLYNKVDFVFNY
ncbi:MAG TPA: DUF1549 domain-containing protein [Bryobacteraceae bacterium]|nr:DUF1549 domain-containing protein [Bryobacteraceae bacterium]